MDERFVELCRIVADLANIMADWKMGRLVVELPDQLPQGYEYRVFFDVRHIGEASTVLVYVQSAYAALRGTGPRGIRSKKVGFRVLVNHALRNTRVIQPP